MKIGGQSGPAPLRTGRISPGIGDSSCPPAGRGLPPVARFRRQPFMHPLTLLPLRRRRALIWMCPPRTCARGPLPHPGQACPAGIMGSGSVNPAHPAEVRDTRMLHAPIAQPGEIPVSCNPAAGSPRVYSAVVVTIGGSAGPPGGPRSLAPCFPAARRTAVGRKRNLILSAS